MVADEPPEDVLRFLRNLADRIEDVSISDEEAGEHSQMLTDVWRLPGTGIEIDSQRIGLSLRGIKNWWTPSNKRCEMNKCCFKLKSSQVFEQWLVACLSSGLFRKCKALNLNYCGSWCAEPGGPWPMVYHWSDSAGTLRSRAWIGLVGNAAVAISWTSWGYSRMFNVMFNMLHVWSC